MPGSIHLGKIAGITLNINFSWLIIFTLLAASLAVGWFPVILPGLAGWGYWGLGVVGALLLFASVLIHELAHSFVAKAHGLGVSDITLFIFGGVSNLQDEPRSPGAEFLIAVVGPLASLAIGIACWLVGLSIGPSAPIFAVELDYLGLSNVLIGVFNLIPGFPLDGGRVLRSFLWALTGDVRQAMHWTLRVSYVIAVAFILAGIWRFFAGNFLFGIWLGFIGWFLLIAANAANRDVAVHSLFRDLTVRAAMSEHPIAVRANLTLDRLVYEHFLPEGQRAAGVVQLGELIGLVTLGDVRQWPREQWPTIPVSYAMVPVTRLSMVSPDERLAEAIRVLADRDVNQLPVVHENELVGMLNRDAVLRSLERHHIGHEDVHIERLALPAEPGEDGAEGEEQPHHTLQLPRAS